MIYPHILLILVLIMAASVSAADAAVTKWKTAEDLTNYYEFRVAELMALRRVLNESAPLSLQTKTNLGITSATVTKIDEKHWNIRIATTHKEGFFYAAYLYDPHNKSIIRRIEYR
ncbi:hypothetical protein [Domibacillus robiginosus]|uniref:hypothetical protein n=1 Tax=Domibacillus robiginosus TaxID=1071054 RepID=UPI00067DA150|nr:hypothetical protein [Domibacillus robiginosus]